MKKIQHIHIGHHYFGAGNVGDDLMVEGFLCVLRRAAPDVRITCATPFDRQSQARRFPEIDWLPYDGNTRADCVSHCDVWLGLGDSPFQIDSGPWFVNHLVQETQLCKHFRKPMFYLCVGVNNEAAMQVPQLRAVIQFADHIWTRDEQSAEFLQLVVSPDKVSAGADLGYISVCNHDFPVTEEDVTAFLFNFENRSGIDLGAFCEYRRLNMRESHRWLVQEVRDLPGSERTLLKQLSADCGADMDVRIPGYSNGSLAELLGCWGSPELLFSSRYHGLMIGAAIGARLVAIRRNDKIGGIASQLGIACMDGFLSADQVQEGAVSAGSVLPGRMQELSERAAHCCSEFLEAVGY